MKDRMDYCMKYIPVLHMIEEDVDLQDACRCHVAGEENRHESVIRFLYDCFMHEGYRCGMVVNNCNEVLVKAGIKDVDHLSEESLEDLDEEGVLACISWHFNQELVQPGSFVSNGVGGGHLLRLLHAYVAKAKESCL